MLEHENRTEDIAMKFTVEQLANNWNLWAEYVDPNGAYTCEEWKSMSEERRIDLAQQVIDAND